MKTPRAELERGNATEAVLVLPVVLGVVFLIIQVGLWAYGRNIAVYSAREGATAAASYESSQSAEAATETALAANADGVLREYDVTSARTGDTVTVTVTGRPISLVPLVELPLIEQTVTVPIELYVP
ncbi:MAG: TadE/TadG family type IV pilus assembly protein [Brachybacterium tyrofermentans]